MNSFETESVEVMRRVLDSRNPPPYVVAATTSTSSSSSRLLSNNISYKYTHEDRLQALDAPRKSDHIGSAERKNESPLECSGKYWSPG